jgi:hypothetical protein
MSQSGPDQDIVVSSSFYVGNPGPFLFGMEKLMTDKIK